MSSSKDSGFNSSSSSSSVGCNTTSTTYCSLSTKELNCYKRLMWCCMYWFQRDVSRFSASLWCCTYCRWRWKSQSRPESSPESGCNWTQHAESEPTRSCSQQHKQKVNWLRYYNCCAETLLTLISATHWRIQNNKTRLMLNSSVDSRAILWANCNSSTKLHNGSSKPLLGDCSDTTSMFCTVSG